MSVIWYDSNVKKCSQAKQYVAGGRENEQTEFHFSCVRVFSKLKLQHLVGWKSSAEINEISSQF